MKMNNLLFGLIIVGMVLVVGCQTTTSPYISDIKIEPSYVKQGEAFSIGFVVNNPLTVAFQGKVEFKSDCFENLLSKKDVSVPSSSKLPFKSEFTVYKPSSDSSDKSKCKGIQQITVLLEDSNDKVVASYLAQLNTVE